MMQARFSLTVGFECAAKSGRRSHVDGSGLIIVVVVERNFIIRLVIKKSSERELEEAVVERFAVNELVSKGIVSIAGAVSQLIRVDRIEVRRICRVDDFRLKWRLLTSQIFRPVNLVEERMVFDLVDIFANTLVFVFT